MLCVCMMLGVMNTVRVLLMGVEATSMVMSSVGVFLVVSFV